jgi:type IV pilus assembly protein PilM
MSLFAKKSYVGLDLGHHTLKAVQVEKTPAGWKVVRTVTATTPPEAIKDGVVVDAHTLGDAIRQMLRAGEINATAAHIAAAGGSVFVRPVPFPKMPEATLRKSIKFEAGRYVPGSVEDSFVEFEIIGPLDETRMNVLIVAAPKDIVESRIQACKAAGLDVESVDVEPFAAYRALIEAGSAEELLDKTIAVVDIGAASTNMSVVHNGVFAMNRSIPAGSRTLTDALKSYFKLTDEDAEIGKAQLNVSELTEENLQENPPLRVLQPHLDDLVREVRRSLNYFQSQNAEGGEARQVDLILLTGGGAKLNGLTTYMEQKLGLPVIAPGVFDNPRFVRGSVYDERGMELAVATGLAMRTFARAA